MYRLYRYRYGTVILIAKEVTVLLKVSPAAHFHEFFELFVTACTDCSYFRTRHRHESEISTVIHARVCLPVRTRVAHAVDERRRPFFVCACMYAFNTSKHRKTKKWI